MRTHAHQSRSPRPEAAFTLIEVALSVAIAAFALVAIIGVMPAGLNVQRENREESIINNDAKFLIDAIRSGNVNASLLVDRVDWVMVVTGGVTNNLSINPTVATASDIIGRLSTPGANVTNHAKVRGLSGSLGDTAGTPTDLMFAYIVSTHLEPYTNSPISPPPIASFQSSNLWDLRLAFQWPLYPNGTIGNSRQSYRVMIAGVLTNAGGFYYFTPNHFQ